MPRLPRVSGATLVKLLLSLGYQVIRQKGSHIRLRKVSDLGNTVAKGTLSDILTRVSLWNNVPKEKLIERLR